MESYVDSVMEESTETVWSPEPATQETLCMNQ